ncbi:PSD1 and planctomycete cytochrome C domain-containing protein [Anatilimnocola sp. NA78]|uniref:PSD1 and planctomycete cytochrome C domain-containing protein n=1 Tax=Anatilimnocola sp. NA78 TaxID=3415683 RepID=UPI003CE50948
MAHRSLRSRCLLAVCLLAGAGSQAFAADKAPTPEQLKFFEEKVRPVLAQNCFKCHGEEKQKGDLRLDLHQAMLTGGESGPAIVPGKPEESLLLDAVKYESLEMPPDGKLSESEIEILTQWVKIGAPWPKEHGGAGPGLRKVKDKITAADREYWAFQPVRRAPVPAIENDHWSRGVIDRFLLARMQTEKLQPAPEAERSTLIRRLSFDLTGLPPTKTEIEAFLADQSPDAYERLVERLLAKPQHGEQWSRHWLDLVRYAESDGYKQDDYRPDAWRYRDYVIRSLNQDKPYPQFIREQLAGDEMPPSSNPQESIDAVVATGYLRLGIYEYNQRDVKGQWSVILNDITDVTADVFMGMGMSCARCHDHKFDPILQKDYFALQAFFAPIMPHDDTPVATPSELTAYQQKMTDWKAKAADILAELAELEKQPLKNAAHSQLNRFPDDVVPILVDKTDEERTPYEKQIFALAFRQAKADQDKLDFTKKLTGEKKERWVALKEQLKEHNAELPVPPPTAMTVTDVGPQAPPVMVPGKPRLGEVLPAIPTVLCTPPADGEATETPVSLPMPPAVLPENSLSTGRRTALANWLGDEANPLTPRVLANRLWQHHFGKGLCEAPSDFGRLGQPPSHPELLDYLAKDFVEKGWNWKQLHRQIVTSAAYRQQSFGPATADSVRIDPANRLLARMPVRRLSAEQIRDSSLAVAGELSLTIGGPAVDATKARRSVYVKVKRNVRDPLLDVFDVADGLSTMPTRNVTTTPIQALLMINGPFMIAKAKAASTVVKSQGKLGPEEQVQNLYLQMLGRRPSDSEQAAAISFLREPSEDKTERTLADLAHVLLNSNEFVYVD